MPDKDQHNETMELVRAVFRDQHGQRLLAAWGDLYVRAKIYRAGDTLEQCAAKDAVRQFVMQIEDMLDGK